MPAIRPRLAVRAPAALQHRQSVPVHRVHHSPHPAAASDLLAPVRPAVRGGRPGSRSSPATTGSIGRSAARHAIHAALLERPGPPHQHHRLPRPLNRRQGAAAPRLGCVTVTTPENPPARSERRCSWSTWTVPNTTATIATAAHAVRTAHSPPGQHRQRGPQRPPERGRRETDHRGGHQPGGIARPPADHKVTWPCSAANRAGPMPET